MGRISKYENTVLCILRNVADTRSDDKLLYYYVLREERFSLCISLESYLLGTGSYPNYDSITRVRRKLQEKYPELRENPHAQAMRSKAEKEFEAYARKKHD